MVVTEPSHETALYTPDHKDAHNRSHLTVLVLGIGIGGQPKLPSNALLLADILNVSETKNNSVITVYFASFRFVAIKLTS